MLQLKVVQVSEINILYRVLYFWWAAFQNIDKRSFRSNEFNRNLLSSPACCYYKHVVQITYETPQCWEKQPLHKHGFCSAKFLQADACPRMVDSSRNCIAYWQQQLASNRRAANDRGGSGRGLFRGTIPTFAWKTTSAFATLPLYGTVWLIKLCNIRGACSTRDQKSAVTAFLLPHRLRHLPLHISKFQLNQMYYTARRIIVSCFWYVGMKENEAKYAWKQRTSELRNQNIATVYIRLPTWLRSAMVTEALLPRQYAFCSRNAGDAGLTMSRFRNSSHLRHSITCCSLIHIYSRLQQLPTLCITQQGKHKFNAHPLTTRQTQHTAQIIFLCGLFLKQIKKLSALRIFFLYGLFLKIEQKHSIKMAKRSFADVAKFK